MTAPRFGLLLLPERLDGFGETCRLAEEAGFDLLGLGDSQSVFREVWVSLTVAALATRRIRLGPLVTNPGTRHAVVTASAVSSLDEVAGGRALLGLGSGDSAIYTLGAPPATVAGLEEAIRTLHALTEGAAIERGGRRWQVHRAHRRIPIYLAAEGPRTIRLAGRVADGVVMGLGLTPDVVRLSLAYLAEGAAEAGRRVEDIDVWWFAKANLADSRAAAVEPIRMALAASANHAFRFTLEGKGVPPELYDRIRGLQREYDSHQHEKLGPTGNAALTDRWGLTEWLAERFAIAGTAEQCADTVAAAMAAGARQFVLTGIVHDPREFIDRCRRELLGRTWPSLAPGAPAPPTIRPYRAEDFDPVNDLWRRARVLAFPDFQARKGHLAEEDRAYFRGVIAAKNALWVAEAGGRPVAFMAIAGDFIDQLYVAPGHQRRGIGAALIAHARRLSPQGLRLFTFQSNAAGRAFYEKEGFVAARLGVSPPPESEPDVEYRWTP